MPDDKEGISLKMVVGGLLKALRDAKQLSDLESTKLLELYKKDKGLTSFTVPAFTVAEADIELRFAVTNAVADPNAAEADINVMVSPNALKGLEAHQVSVMKLKIAPVGLRVYEEEK